MGSPRRLQSPTYYRGAYRTDVAASSDDPHDTEVGPQWGLLGGGQETSRTFLAQAERRSRGAPQKMADHQAPTLLLLSLLCRGGSGPPHPPNSYSSCPCTPSSTCPAREADVIEPIPLAPLPSPLPLPSRMLSCQYSPLRGRRAQLLVSARPPQSLYKEDSNEPSSDGAGARRASSGPRAPQHGPRGARIAERSVQDFKDDLQTAQEASKSAQGPPRVFPKSPKREKP